MRPPEEVLFSGGLVVDAVEVATSRPDIVVIVRPHAAGEQVRDDGQVSCHRGGPRGRRQATCLAGLLAMVLAGGLMASDRPALAASPLSWSPPTLIDSQPPYPELDGVSCPSSGLCVGVDAFGNVVTSTEPTGGAGTWILVNVDGGNRIWGVSCTSAPVCVAVDSAGDVVTSTEPTSGASKWSVTHVDGSHAILGVSCVSGPLCVAVDSAGDVLTSTDPSGGEHAWTVTHVDGHLIRNVSCASSSLCVAVDEAGNVIVSTQPVVGTWAVAHVDGETYILGVSCPSTSLCVAVDAAGKVLTSSEPAGGEHAWASTEVDSHALIGVSCSSESLCVAFDSVGNVLTSTEPTTGKSAWSTAHVDPDNILWGVSCTVSLCVVVNGYGNALTSANPTQGGDSWITTHVDSSNPVGLTSISCASTSLCVAADSGGNEVEDVVTSTDPIGGTGAWTTTPLRETGFLSSVSCPSTTLCIAGNHSKALFTSTDPTGGASAWIYQTEYAWPPIESPNAKYFGPLASVSCASVSFCVADLDSYNDFDTLATSTDPIGGGSAWLATTPYIMGDRSGKPILGVSCASVSLCVAADGAGSVLTSTDPTSSEATWTVVPVDISPLWAVSCPSNSFCVAVDGAGNVVTSTDPTGGSSAWSVVNVDGTTKLTSVSCASESLCVAVDADGNALSSTDPSGGPDAWSAVPVDPGHTLTSVSCTPGSAGLCVAVDNASYAVTSTFSPQTEGGQFNGPTEGSTTTTGTSPPPPAVSGMLRILRVKVDVKGRVVLTLKASTAGSAKAVATASIGEATRRKKSRCKAERARKITYGRGSGTARGANIFTVTIRPTKEALNTLEELRVLRVPITVIFHPLGGSPITVSEVVTVRYYPSPRRSGMRFGSKDACRGKR